VDPATSANPGASSNGAAASGFPQRELLNHAEKLRLQIMRVQIKLRSLGLYDGQIDGVMTEDTRTSLRYFQDLKGLQSTGTMTTATLNAMGIPAVN
jgi:His-Xaa-Ser repeat protein HxsA